MTAPLHIGDATLYQGDCLAVMPTLAADSLDAIVTDPPYGLAFMGKDWDHGIPGPAFWVEALRVAKPGAHLLAFGGTRTFHRLVCAIEDAGWEVRDVLMWVYGNGFPKSLDVSKAIDKAAGAEREVVGQRKKVQSFGADVNNVFGGGPDKGGIQIVTAPATEAARQWAGWGTALKPAYEPILLARKPLAGTVAGNVLAHGCGALNVDGCRVGTDDAPGRNNNARSTGTSYVVQRVAMRIDNTGGLGRWPANFIHDGSPEVVALFPQTRPSPTGPVKQGGHHRHDVGLSGATREGFGVGYADTGTAARFFYTAKAGKDDRDEGLDQFDAVPTAAMAGNMVDGQRLAGNGAPIKTPMRANHHPTVKPVSLMRYLCRLVTPPGGMVLDPFMGSGSTGKGAMMEGFRFTGIEREAEYFTLALHRLRAAQRQPDLFHEAGRADARAMAEEDEAA